MGVYSIVISLLILILIPIYELFREKNNKIDFLSFINLVFVLAYGVTPIYIYSFPEKTSNWHSLLNNNELDSKFLVGILIACLFYIITILSYNFSNKLFFVCKSKSLSRKIFSKDNNNIIFQVAVILFIIGFISLLIYIRVVGGFSDFLQLGSTLRSDSSYIQHPLMFLVHLTNMVNISSFIFFALIKYSNGFSKLCNLLLFIVSAISSLLVVFHSSGRMTAFTYIVTFPLAILLYQNRIKIKTILFSSFLFIFVLLYGNSLFDYEGSLEMSRGDQGIINSIVSEFAFPFVNVSNAYNFFPSTYFFRGGFLDIINGLVELLPSRILDVDFLKQETITDFNTSLYEPGGTIPVDIISFGYMSFGIVGVILTACFFGTITKWIENFLSERNNFVSLMFYTSLGIFLSFRLMYGDPVKISKDIFPYAAAIFLIAIVIRLRKPKYVNYNKK